LNTTKRLKILLLSILLTLSVTSYLRATGLNEGEMENAPSPRELLHSCARMIPVEPLILTGELIVRKQRGIELARHSFQLMTDWGASPPSAECHMLAPGGTAIVERVVLTRPGNAPAQIKIFKDSAPDTESSSLSLAGRVRGTDMTWMDLTLDFLWWQDVRFDSKAEDDCRIGRSCYVLLAAPPHNIPGCSALRIWIDKQLRCVMQTEQLNSHGETVRRMWVQRVKKMDDRWMIRHMEIETLDSGHRTKLLINDVAKP